MKEYSIMTPEKSTVNTPETLGVTPRYIIQHHSVSRSAHGLSAVARKLAAMAMSLLPADLSSRTVAFTFQEFCKAMGMSVGGEQYQIFRKAVRECMQCLISIETEPDEKGKKAWKEFTWFSVAEFDEKTGNAKMTFSSELADFLMALKWMYSKINLKDIGGLQSRYAIKFFEMAMSYESMQGKQGNADNSWFFEWKTPELRMIMGVPEKSYKKTSDFRKYVIDEPVKELNNAGLGLKIMPEGIKQGRKIAAIRFYCKKTPRTVKGKRSEEKESTQLPEPDFRTEQMLKEKELEHLKELYPDEFAELYEAELANTPSWMPKLITQVAAEGSALLQLKERHGIKK
jgi:plasmid replication initiation protein